MTFRKRHINATASRARGRKSGNCSGEGFLFVTLLQTMLCAVMIAAAFVMSSIMGMTEIKMAYNELATSDTDAVAVFSAAKKAADSQQVVQLKQVMKLIIEQVFGEKNDNSGGMLPYDFKSSKLPKGVTTAKPITAAPMSFPMEGRITSQFGPRENPVTGKSDWHTGVDIAAAEGTAISAAWPGVVCDVASDSIYGNYIVIDHGGFKTRYCHCSRIAASEGMRLRQGETAAFCGSTGMSTGPHLHFELIVGGRCADPMLPQPRWIPLETA